MRNRMPCLGWPRSPYPSLVPALTGCGARPNIYSEPYFVAAVSDLPSYDERYRGYGAGDKALHYHYAHKLGLATLVHPNLFVLHLPHGPSAWRSSGGDAAYAALGPACVAAAAAA